MYTNTCVLCGKTFECSHPKSTLCHSPHEKTCENCGDTFFVTSENKTKRFCSLKCSGEYRRKSGYGKQIASKGKDTKLKRYGTLASPVNKSPRVCEICGDTFIPTSNHQTTCGKVHYGPCPVCGKPGRIYSAKQGPCCCSDECKMKLVQNKVRKKYGSYSNSTIQKKRKQTIEERYGNEIYQRTEDYKLKTNRTNMERYGVPWSFQNAQVRDKIVRTFRSKYGKHPMQCLSTIETRRELSMKRHGVSHPSQTSEQKAKYKHTCEEKYGVASTLLLDKSIERQPCRISSYNVQFSNLLHERGVSCEFECLVGEYRYDIGLSDIRVVVEINPTDTHNSYRTIRGHEGLPSNYHINRTIQAEHNGWRCVHVWDWDDVEKVADMFMPKHKVYARQCDIKEIDTKTANNFFKLYHFQGPCRGASLCVGLYLGSLLVGAMAVGKPRFDRSYDIEILRLCYDSEFTVVAGAERLFSYVLRHVSPHSVVSYCDRSKFTGDVYTRLGMVQQGVAKPVKHWYSTNRSEQMQHITSSTLLRLGFDKLFGTSYGKGTNNEELMIQRGYRPVYDCGQMKFAWHDMQ